MKITIRLPRFLNWMAAKALPLSDDDIAQMSARAKMTGTASSSKKYGNAMASVEMTAVYEDKTVTLPKRS